MKLWIALGITVILATYFLVHQPQTAPQPQVSAVILAPPQPLVSKHRAIMHPAAKSMLKKHEDDSIDETNFVEAEDEPQKAPDELRYEKKPEESTPLTQLTNFRQDRNQNAMISVTYGNIPTTNIKIENREFRHGKSFVASEIDQ